MQYRHQQQIDAIAEHIIEICQHHPSTKHGLDQAFIDNVFMVTMKLDGVDVRGLVDLSHKRPFDVDLNENIGWRNYQRDIGSRQRKLPLHLYFDVFDRWCRYLNLQSFGRKFYRPKEDQPLIFAFIDFPGSRRREQISMAELLSLGRLHLHAIVPARPGKGQQCIQHLRHMKNGFDNELKKFVDVNIRHYDPEQGLSNLIDYCSKGAQAVDCRHAWDDMHEVFPRKRVDKIQTKTKKIVASNFVLPSANVLGRSQVIS